MKNPTWVTISFAGNLLRALDPKFINYHTGHDDIGHFTQVVPDSIIRSSS